MLPTLGHKQNAAPHPRTAMTALISSAHTAHTAITAHTAPNAPTPANRSAALGLGLDAGGTQTRYALTRADGQLQAEGAVAGLSGLQLATADGLAQVQSVLAEIARALPTGQAPSAVVAGVTGFAAEHQALLHPLLADTFGVPLPAVQSMTDIELACHSAFAPGQGCVVYAGTGSIAAHIDAAGTMHRAGGRGAVIDDAGGGHWIARQALLHIWRAEDEAPGAWQRSTLAQEVFKVVGGSDWADTRAWVYGASRGELGTLALAVAAAAAAEDSDALLIFQNAGRELARLALALQRRLRPLPLPLPLPLLPIALAGRVFELHASIELSLRAALPADAEVQRLTLKAHHTAARLAAAKGLT